MAPRKYSLGKRAEAVEETRRRIIDATFDLHSQKGVVATTVQDIAERADVALRTVYYHFPTTDDLVAGCGAKVRAVIAAPDAGIFGGVGALGDRLRLLLRELFEMYERGAVMIERARCEQHAVLPLARFVAEQLAVHERLVREAVRPARPPAAAVREVTALTDFYVWKACHEQGISTTQAVDVVLPCLVAALDRANDNRVRRTHHDTRRGAS